MHIFEVRFGKNPKCPKCCKSKKWYRISGTRRFQHPCGYAITPTAQTIFTHSTIPVQLWLYAMLHFSNVRVGVCTHFIERQLGLSYKAAYRVNDRIRTHMAAIDQQKCIGVFGEQVFVRVMKVKRLRVSGKKGTNRSNVLAIADDKRILNTVIGQARRTPISAILDEKIVKGAEVCTDCYETYRILSAYGSRPEKARFLPFWDTGRKMQNDTITSFWTTSSRAFASTHKHLNRSHLWKYLKEFEFRYNRRWESEQIFWNLVSDFPRLDAQSVENLRQWNSKIIE